MTQRELFHPSLDEQYERWKRSEHGLAVLAAARERALRLRHRGFKHYGIKCILEAIRFDFALQLGADDDGFKVNNNYSSRIARDLMASYPELSCFFETRELKS